MLIVIMETWTKHCQMDARMIANTFDFSEILLTWYASYLSLHIIICNFWEWKSCCSGGFQRSCLDHVDVDNILCKWNYWLWWNIAEWISERWHTYLIFSDKLLTCCVNVFHCAKSFGIPANNHRFNHSSPCSSLLFLALHLNIGRHHRGLYL